MSKTAFIYGLLVLVCSLCQVNAMAECEVCVKVINNYKTAAEKKGSANEAAGKKKKLSVEAMGDLLESFCSKQKNRKDNKICYNLLPMKNEIVRQTQLGKDTLRICKALSKKNPDFCSIRYPIKTDADTDYSKMRVKQLKAVLSDRGVDCNGCLEKSDYVKRCKETEHIEL